MYLYCCIHGVLLFSHLMIALRRHLRQKKATLTRLHGIGERLEEVLFPPAAPFVTKETHSAREWGEVTNEFHNSNKIPCSCHVMHSLRLINAINNCTFRVSTHVDPRSQLCRGLHIISRHFFFLSFRVSFNSFFFFLSSRAYRGLKAKRVNFLIKNAQQQQLDDDTPVNTQVKEGVREALKNSFYFSSVFTFLRRIEDKQSWRENYR